MISSLPYLTPESQFPEALSSFLRYPGPMQKLRRRSYHSDFKLAVKLDCIPMTVLAGLPRSSLHRFKSHDPASLVGADLSSVLDSLDLLKEISHSTAALATARAVLRVASFVRSLGLPFHAINSIKNPRAPQVRRRLRRQDQVLSPSRLDPQASRPFLLPFPFLGHKRQTLSLFPSRSLPPILPQPAHTFRAQGHQKGLPEPRLFPLARLVHSLAPRQLEHRVCPRLHHHAVCEAPRPLQCSPASSISKTGKSIRCVSQSGLAYGRHHPQNHGQPEGLPPAHPRQLLTQNHRLEGFSCDLRPQLHGAPPLCLLHP